VFEADSLLRERPGSFPFDLEDNVLIQFFKSPFLLIHPASCIPGRPIQSSNRGLPNAWSGIQA